MLMERGRLRWERAAWRGARYRARGGAAASAQEAGPAKPDEGAGCPSLPSCRACLLSGTPLIQHWGRLGTTGSDRIAGKAREKRQQNRGSQRAAGLI